MKKVVLLWVCVFLMSSCVEGDLYDLYDEEELSINALIKKNKLNSDVVLGSSDVLLGNSGSWNGKAVFYSTECAAYALSYYLSGGKLEGDKLDCIDNTIKLDAVKALMNWTDEDYSFALNPDRNYQYKTTIMDNGGGASTQNQMIPAISILFHKSFISQSNASIYMQQMVNDGVLVNGMFYIITSGHVSVPYNYNNNTCVFTCYDSDGGDFTTSISNIISVLIENND